MNAEDAADHARVWQGLARRFANEATEYPSGSSIQVRIWEERGFCDRVSAAYAELAKEKE